MIELFAELGADLSYVDPHVVEMRDLPGRRVELTAAALQSAEPQSCCSPTTTTRTSSSSPNMLGMCSMLDVASVVQLSSISDGVGRAARWPG